MMLFTSYNYSQPNDSYQFMKNINKANISVTRVYINIKQIIKSTHNIFQENPMECFKPIIYFFQGQNINTKQIIIYYYFK